MERTLVMGILNVTPDSFSDGGRYLATEAAVAHGLALRQDGADLVDVGGESTRPGAPEVPVDVELARVMPVVAALASHGVSVSVDTKKAEVALAAITAGAAVINDVSGGLADAGMAAVIAAHPQVRYVVGHWRGNPELMDELAHYDDVVGEVVAELSRQILRLRAAGVAPSQLVLDPNLGFAKLGAHNWQVLAGLAALQHLGLPILVGASRKRFLAANSDDVEAATVAVTALVAAAGVWAVRVHNVKANRAAVDVVTQLSRYRSFAGLTCRANRWERNGVS